MAPFTFPWLDGGRVVPVVGRQPCAQRHGPVTAIEVFTHGARVMTHRLVGFSTSHGGREALRCRRTRLRRALVLHEWTNPLTLMVTQKRFPLTFRVRGPSRGGGRNGSFAVRSRRP
ncbi:predicted protein [Streptomyces viridosporus ATCC 14672]|uniref:Predicted protein n=1 Tax=Streptomyces viridosporus (strain ATCC 14672 / DSM 40746 / JCM 4963 / KCTC 9882 / NRRL B-12104 / FH 1290) TaxID=566461 RepID=D5ZZS6_STRV1|nr:predicted protein [Streptomyces viridosporus ATCC 14672]